MDEIEYQEPVVVELHWMKTTGEKIVCMLQEEGQLTMQDLQLRLGGVSRKYVQVGISTVRDRILTMRAGTKYWYELRY